MNFKTIKYWLSKKDRTMKGGANKVLSLDYTRMIDLRKDWYLGLTEPTAYGYGYDTDNLQLWIDEAIDIDRHGVTIQAYPIKEMPTFDPNQWPMNDRIKKGSGNFTHYSGMVISKKLYKAPIVVEYSGLIPQKSTFLPSVWLISDVGKITREIDCFEAYSGRIFFTTHSGGVNYANRKVDSTILYRKNRKSDVIRVEVYEDKVLWYLNGVLVKQKKFDSKNVDYFVEVSLSVSSPKTVNPANTKDHLPIYNESLEWKVGTLNVYA